MSEQVLKNHDRKLSLMFFFIFEPYKDLNSSSSFDRIFRPFHGEIEFAIIYEAFSKHLKEILKATVIFY